MLQFEGSGKILGPLWKKLKNLTQALSISSYTLTIKISLAVKDKPSYSTTKYIYVLSKIGEHLMVKKPTSNFSESIFDH